MKLKNTFVGGKMNKDIDERLLPKGQYPHAENIRVANSDGSDMGAIENVKGNEKLTNLNLTNGKAIGVFSDDSNQKIYWFVTSDDKDLIVEYDVKNSSTNILRESSIGGVLNFNKNFLITGVTKIINGDSSRDLLAWTDDYNGVRLDNIERAKLNHTLNGSDSFIEDDIALIKKPPRYAPKTSLTFTPTTLENNIENKFLTFAYRYQYLDGGYSALSSFTNYAFAPSEFDLDFQTMENEGMKNTFNAVNIEFNTGDERVKRIDLVYKESNSNTVYVIETFDKSDESWGDNEVQSFRFSNSKSKIALPLDELFRDYDNVPKKAKALELIGTRLALANYVEQYDLVNVFGEDIKVDYDLTLINKDITGSPLESIVVDSVNLRDSLFIDKDETELKRNSRITFDITLGNVSNNGSYSNSFDFIFNRDFEDMTDLAEDPEFIYFVEEVMTGHFTGNYNMIPPENSTVEDINGFSISASSTNSLTIQAPVVVFRVDNTPEDTEDNPTNTVLEFASFEVDPRSNVSYSEIAVATSLKTNRSYEVGLKYLDAESRATTVLTDEDNTIYVDQDFSANQNKIVVSLNHRPPVWADRYKLVVKQNKGTYQTIYTNIFYEDGLFRWVKIEGANVNKVTKGDTLIVKSDLGGIVSDPIKVRVLELETKERDFIVDNEDDEGNPIIEEEGLYMKIKPTGFDMNFDSSTARSFEGGSHLRYTKRTATQPALGTYDESGTFQPYKLNAGSRVRIYVKFKGRGSISYEAIYDQRFRVNNNYDSIQDWFEAEVEDLGSFGEDFTRGQITGQYPNLSQGVGEYDYGYGFTKSGQDGYTQDGENFYVWSHRDGTASRRITTTVKIEVLSTEGIVIFETESKDLNSELYYETEQTFDIVSDFHEGNLQNQSELNPNAIVELDFFNCYVQGNGAESYRFKDSLNSGVSEDGEQLLANYLNIDLRPSTTSIEKYREVRRFGDITYSEPYNENTNLNGLGSFNLSKANYKEDIDKKFGFIQKLYSRDTDLVVFQEDKVSRVLYGKDLLMNTDGSSNLSSIEDVLGQQVPYQGEYGISRNPESFAIDAFSIYFVDSKRGCVCRLGRNGITEISMAGLRTWFKDEFKDSVDNKKLGSYDPFLDQYVLHSSSEELRDQILINCSESISRGNFDGVQEVVIDYGIFTGDAGFEYSSNGVPVKYDLEWNGEFFSTGYVGDESYNAELISLGLGSVVGSGNGTLTFDKNLSLPRTAKVTITAPICDTSFNISGNCVSRDNLTVKSIILNDEADLGKFSTSRYKWFNEGYSSPFTSYDSELGEGDLELFETNVGQEGSTEVPLTNSVVRLESYDGFSQTLEWVPEENRMGYLVSNVDYTESDLETILSQATYPEIAEVSGVDDAVTRFIDFNYDPTSGQQYLYLIWDYRNKEVVIDQDTKIRIYFDSSGSMNSTLAPLQEMKETILKDRLLPLYNNDSDLYDASVEVVKIGASEPENSEFNERTLGMLNMLGDTPQGNVIAMVFQDEASAIYHSTGITPKTPTYESDVQILRNRLATFSPNYYRGVVFQVEGYPVFKELIQAVQTGSGEYSGANGLSDRQEFNYKYDLADGGTPQYYLDQIVVALQELGYEL